MKRSIGVVTGARSEYGVLRPLLRAIARAPGLELQLYVTGGHLSRRFGMTVRDIERDRIPVAARVPILGRGVATAQDAAQAFARGVTGFSRLFAARRPDLLLVMSDRYEMLAAATAAMFNGVITAHLSGGKTTQGSTDEYVRHAVTKMSHYHFTHNPLHRRRIIRMGEQPSRVFAYGSPLLDDLVPFPRMDEKDLRARAGLRPRERYVVVLYHPETLDAVPAEKQMREVLEAVKGLPYRKILFYPGADVGSDAVIRALQRFSEENDAPLFKNLPREVFANLLKRSEALVGNSSCGVTDTPTLQVPTVNIGDRQKGMLKAGNVVDSRCRAKNIRAALRKALSPGFRARLRGLKNPYGDGRASARIVRKLKTLDLSPAILKKPFYDA
jgi:UDP-hydrolysing UDP-N-acetyl-D-glucosamine 2-epimerase